MLCVRAYSAIAYEIGLFEVYLLARDTSRNSEPGFLGQTGLEGQRNKLRICVVLQLQTLAWVYSVLQRHMKNG